MSQPATWGVPRAGPSTPTAFAGAADDSLDALLDSNSGATAPAYAVAGTLWLDTSGTPRILRAFDGTSWRVIGRLESQRSTMGNANYTFAAGDAQVSLATAFTAPRTLTLPLANSVPGGTERWIVDEVGAVSATNTLTIARSGSDLINNAASLVITAPFGAFRAVSDGTSRWTIGDAITVAQADARYVNINGDTMTSNLVISAANPLLELNKTASSGQNILIAGRRDNLLRWHVDLGSSASEAGSNSGSDFAVYRYADLGGFLSTPLTISRSTGVMTLEQTPTVGSNAVHHDGLAPRVRAAANFANITSPSTRWSMNISSITDNGTGDVTLNFTTAMPDANYVVTGSSMWTSGGATNVYAIAVRAGSVPTTTSVRIVMGANSDVRDVDYVYVAIIR